MKKFLLIGLLSLVSLFQLNAQDWAGRRYLSEDPSALHAALINVIKKDADFQKFSVVEQNQYLAIIYMIEFRMAIVFKSKMRCDFTVIAKANEAILKATNVDDEKRALISEAMSDITNDLKSSGTYSFDGNKLTITEKNGDSLTFKLLDDEGKKISSDEYENVVLARVK
ncbi:MAG: hypothetical protein J6Z32_07575 [Bacteroidales bacterium]|nr:hypothetical protein [Bacteroidales bacterium]